MDCLEFLLKDIDEACMKDKEQQNLARRVYLDLSEVRGWWNVKLHTKKDLDYVFISGHPNRHEPRQVVLPLFSSEMLSPMTINHYLQQVKLEDTKTEGLTLAISESDTTTVYYKVSDGLVQPESPDVSDIKRYERHQTLQKRKADLDQNVQSYLNRMKRKQEDG